MSSRGRMLKKNFAVIFILICFINLCFPIEIAVAKSDYKNIKNTSLQIVRENKHYGLIDKNTQKSILPIVYNKIKTKQLDNKVLISAKVKNLYESVYASDGSYSDFIKKYIDFNNNSQNINFYNYPSAGSIIYRHKRLYGLIFAEKDYIRIIPPVFREIHTPDENSIIFQTLKITFADKKDIILVYDLAKYYSSLYEYLYEENFFHELPVKIKYIELNENADIANGKLILEYSGFNSENYKTETKYQKGKGFKLFNKKKNRYKNIKNYLKTIELKNKETVFLVKQDGKYGIESSENKIIIPITFINIFDTTDEKLLRKIASAQLRQYKNRKNIYSLPANVLKVVYITLPLLGPLEYYATQNIMDGYADEYEKYDAE